MGDVLVRFPAGRIGGGAHLLARHSRPRRPGGSEPVMKVRSGEMTWVDGQPAPCDHSRWRALEAERERLLNLIIDMHAESNCDGPGSYYHEHLCIARAALEEEE